MAFSVNTNAGALAALSTLNQTNRSLEKTQERINTGFKVNGARDNASTFAIAQGMRGDVAGLKAVQDSISLGSATVGVALSAATQISDKLNQMKQKVLDGQASNVDRGKIQADIDSLGTQITDLANAAQFNGVNLLTNVATAALQVTSSLNRTAASGSGSVTVATVDVDSQDVTAAGLGVGGVSITGNNSITVTLDSAAAVADDDIFQFDVGGTTYIFEFTDGSAALTSTADSTTEVYAVVIDTATDSAQSALGKFFQVARDAGFSVTNGESGTFTLTAGGAITGESIAATIGTVAAAGADPSAQIDTLETAIDQINGFVADLGVAANRLTAQGDFVKSLSDTLTNGVSALVDADLAEESATLQSLQTKQQLGIQALSIANQQSGAVLALFR
jgi:flagellin